MNPSKGVTGVHLALPSAGVSKPMESLCKENSRDGEFPAKFFIPLPRVLKLSVNMATHNLKWMATLTCLFVPRLRQPAMAVTVADQFGSPANVVTSTPLRFLAARFSPELKLDGKLEERFAPSKLFLSGTADLKWISESLRLLRSNGMEPLFVSPTSNANVEGLITGVQEVGLAAHICESPRLFFDLHHEHLAGDLSLEPHPCPPCCAHTPFPWSYTSSSALGSQSQPAGVRQRPSLPFQDHVCRILKGYFKQNPGVAYEALPDLPFGIPFHLTSQLKKNR